MDAIIDAGWVELDQLPATLAAADVGIYMMDDTLLNRTKCPVKLADMLVAGVPVVAEAVGQVSEYVRDRQTGVLAASGDVQGLTTAATELLTDPATRAQMGAAARVEVLERFGWDRLTTRLEGVYGG